MAPLGSSGKARAVQEGSIRRVAPVAAALAIIVALLTPVDGVLALLPDAGPEAAAPDLSGRDQTGPPILATSTLLQPAGGDSGFKAVTAGYRHSCGLRSDGVIVCWGSISMRTADPVSGGGSVDVFHLAADALEELGVLEGTGCADGSGLCPSEPLRRWEMAVWLVRVLDDDEPQRSVSRFDDVDAASWWAPYTERLAELSVTSGCSTESLRFCPEGPVTRGQMAAFLVRAFELDAGPRAGFVDVAPTDTFADDIDALAAAGVTVGCSAVEPARYCPRDIVPRGQMAVFLARALGLIEASP